MADRKHLKLTASDVGTSGNITHKLEERYISLKATVEEYRQKGCKISYALCSQSNSGAKPTGNQTVNLTVKGDHPEFEEKLKQIGYTITAS